MAVSKQPDQQSKLTPVIAVSIVEDEAHARNAMSAILRGTPGFKLVSVHATGEDALANLPCAKADVVLVDIGLKNGANGIECVRGLKNRRSDLNILMFTVYEDPDKLFESLKAGANGYILKKTPPAQILTSIQEVVNGGAPMTPSIARKVLQFFSQPAESASASRARKPMEGLTDRENEVLHVLSTGKAYKNIADELGISCDTIRNHIRNIYVKLHVHSRTEAMMKYLSR